MKAANDNKKPARREMFGPWVNTQEWAGRIGSRFFCNWTVCKNGHVSKHSAKDGRCCECGKDRRRKSYWSNPELARAKAMESHFLNRDRELARMKEYSELNADEIQARHKAYREENRERRSEQAKEWHAANKDRDVRYRQEHQELYAAHARNRRARLRDSGGTHTAEDIADLLRLQKYKCVECGASIRKRDNRHVDHIYADRFRRSERQVKPASPLCILQSVQERSSPVGIRQAKRTTSIMLQLRPYQADAVDAILKEFEDIDSTLLVASVGAGKTIMQASFIQRVIGDYPEARFVCAVHTRELVKQNFEALIRAWPFAPAGINSAALGQRSTRAQILFCSIQSVYKLAQQIGWVDCLIIDESHLVSPNGTTMYRQFIAELRAINPDLRILGMSGTPFRMDMGMLTDGDDPLFKTVAYEIGVGKLIEDGYLTRPISKGTATTFDVSGVHTRGGEYVAGELERAVNKSEITEAAVDEIIRYGCDRRAWIAFAAGVDHAAEIRDEMNRRGVVAEMVEGSMPAAERTRIIENYKAGRIKCLSNVNVLSIGFDYPAIDLIALMRPTKSPALYIQQCGRGLRLSPGKETCLILDFANVVRTLGPIDNVQIKAPGKGNGDAPIRICPECESINHAAARVCVDCGHQFPEPEIKVNAVAEDLPVLSNATTWRAVTSRRFAEHPGKEGKPPSVKCSYTCGFLNVNSWLCPQHSGYAKTKADHWWRDHGGQRPFPDSVEAWLLRQHELNDTAEIEIEYNGKWPNARSYKAAAANDNQPPAANDNELSAGMRELLDDEIQF